MSQFWTTSNGDRKDESSKRIIMKKTEFIILRVEKELKDKLVKKAQNLGIKLSAFVRKILNEKN